MAVTVSNTLITAINTLQTATDNIATANTDNLAEVFTYTPTAGCDKLVICFSNTYSQAYTYSIAASSEYWAGTSALTGTVAAKGSASETMAVLQLDSAKVKSGTGTIVITLTPYTDTKLASEHVATVRVIELL